MQAEHEYTLLVSSETWARLVHHLRDSNAERMAFGYCSAFAGRRNTRLVLRDVAFPSDEEYSRQASAHVCLDAVKTVPYLMRAKDAGGFLDAHSHPFPGVPCPSPTDEIGARRQFAALQGPAPGAVLVRLIRSADDQF